MKQKIYLLLLFLVGLINFIPVVGLFSANQLIQTYGVELNSNELQLLMRHRALLFGLLGGLVFLALIRPHLQVAAMFMTGLSMVGFLFLVGSIGGLNEQLIEIAVVDVVGVVCLLLAFIFKWLLHKEAVAQDGR